jgi:hypothetical protein
MSKQQTQKGNGPDHVRTAMAGSMGQHPVKSFGRPTLSGLAKLIGIIVQMGKAHAVGWTGSRRFLKPRLANRIACSRGVRTKRDSYAR